MSRASVLRKGMDAALEGAWLKFLYRYGSKVVFRKLADGRWQLVNVNGNHPASPLPMHPEAIIGTWCDDDRATTQIVHHIPRVVRIHGWLSVLGSPFWGWACYHCEALPEADREPDWFGVMYADPQIAHNEARSHATLHTQVGAS